MPEVHLHRRDALRAALRERELTALLVTDLVNVRYLSGFTGSNAALLVGADEAHSALSTDGRYTTQAAEQAPELRTVSSRDCARALLGAAAERGEPGPIGFDSAHVTVDGMDGLTDAAVGIELRRAPGAVEGLREIKDDTEIDALRTACAAADSALADLLAAGGIRPGRTEREVALELEVAMRAHGADGPAFETILAAGEHSAIPHHRPTDRPLATGDLVKIDFGALVDGYHSDMTRTLVLGPPADWQRELYELVLAAQRAGCAALGAGVPAADVDAAARTVIADAGYGERFVHGLGHGVGLRVHEAPALSKTGTARLAAGMALTVEPGVYLPGRGGVRIEDTLVVRGGAAEPLTLTTRELVVV